MTYTNARSSLSRSVVLLAILACLTSCGWTSRLQISGGTSGSVRLEARDSEVVIAPKFTEAYYLSTSPTELTAVLLDGPVDQARNVAVIRVLWYPKPARTPIAPTATNAAINFVRFDESGKVGVYSGGGYVYPSNKSGKPTVGGGVWHSNIVLSDATEGYEDPIKIGAVVGEFNAQRDDAKVTSVLSTIDKKVSAALGYPRGVKAVPAVSPLAAK